MFVCVPSVWCVCAFSHALKLNLAAENIQSYLLWGKWQTIDIIDRYIRLDRFFYILAKQRYVYQSWALAFLGPQVVARFMKASTSLLSDFLCTSR